MSIAPACRFTSADVSAFYRLVFRWPTVIDSDSGVIRLYAGDVVDALIVQRDLAIEASRVLAARMQLAPIIVVGQPVEQWLFLTQGQTDLRASTWCELEPLPIHCVESGSPISLPTVDGPPGDPRWQVCPQSEADLPQWATVIAAIRAAAAGWKW